jgi:multiple sugar transport system permease protein
MFAKEGGLLNMVSILFGGKSINWLGYDFARKSLIIMLLWSSGSGILTNLAAMKAVPNDLYEAAEIEGAGYFTKLFKITLPLISNMIYMNLVTGIIGMLQLFGQPVLLTSTAGAGLTALPIRPIYTYLVHVYQQIFVNLRFGYGLAMVWVIFTIIMLLTMIMDKTSKYWVNNEMN